MSDDEKLDKTSIIPSDTFKRKMEEAKTNPASIILLMGPINLVGKQWKITSNHQIGRLIDLEICVDDRSMSRRHAEVRLVNGKVFIEDLGSSNGTEVAGNKLKPGEAVELRDNDQIKLGNVIFKYLAEGNIEAVTNTEALNRALTDPLTKINNRLAFLEKVEQIFRKAIQTNVNLSLIVFDLDKFKSINDNYGHQAGDFVLKTLSAVVQSKLRPSDFFSRYGGEEFTILVSGGDLKVAMDLAERLRSAIEDHDFIYQGTRLPVTISAGVACIDSSMTKWEELFEKADQASYKSKQDGRNRVSTLD
tara:strand:- start:11298 stop:12212 length:915 start_codon:yes stop_codon:yes gene_type:complete